MTLANASLRPIPTKYAGVQFRSRLEARWAAFFDLAKWTWEFEPPEEIGWLPDFLLIGADHVIKVEVKPIQWVGDDYAVTRQATAIAELDKVRRYVADQSAPYCPSCAKKHHEDVLVLGAYPHFFEQIHIVSTAMLGVFLGEQWHEPELGGRQSDIAGLGGGHTPRILDFYAHYGCFEYRMGGEYDSDRHLLPCDQVTVQRMWRQAGNIVQWRAPV